MELAPQAVRSLRNQTMHFNHRSMRFETAMRIPKNHSRTSNGDTAQAAKQRHEKDKGK